MIDALRRKTEISEDVVTSAVFGTLRYLNRPDVVAEFLSRARNVKGEPLSEIADRKYVGVSLSFWPGWHKREPDVVVELTDKRGERTVVVVEAKLGAGKTQKDLLQEDEDNVRDQLADYWLQMQEEYHDVSTERRFLVFVTDDSSMPVNDLRDTLSEQRLINDHAAEKRIGWTRWSELEMVLQDAPGAESSGSNSRSALGMRKMVEDMLAILHKEGIQPFFGFERLAAEAERVTHAIRGVGSPAFFRREDR